MGVGVYRNDFQGAGASINVSGPLTEDGDYAAYVADTKAEGDEPMSRMEWDRSEYDLVNEFLLDAVGGVARELGFHGERTGRFEGASARWDREISLIASDDVFELGWRSWQHDFVVAIGPGRAFEDGMGRDGVDAEWAFDERGRGKSALEADYFSALSALEELLRLTLERDGLETTVPTSGYTSARWAARGGDPAARRAELVEQLKATLTRLAMEPDEAMKSAPADERVEMARTAMAIQPGFQQPSLVLVATCHDDGASLWDPEDEENGLVRSASVADPAVRAFFATLPKVDGSAAVPCTAETEPWFRSLQKASPARIVISAEQWSAITGKPCIVSWMDDDTGTPYEQVLHGETEPAEVPPGP